MGTLTAAFGLAWLAVSVYVAWLGEQQRRLHQRLNRIEQQDRQDSRSESSGSPSRDRETIHSRAA